MANIRLAPRGFLGLCASAMVLLAGCGAGSGASQGTGAPLTVTTVEVAPKTLPLIIETVGRSEGSKEVEVRARVSGILEKQNYNEGTKVKAGQQLFRIEASPYEIALAHARAALAEEQARNVQARRNADRLTGLAKANAVSRRVADDALSTVESSDAALLAAQANVREAELNVSYTKVVAPISGITGRALHSEGSLLNATTESSLLTTLTQADPMWVRFALSENEYATLRTVESTQPDSLSVALLDKNGSPRGSQGKLNFSGSTIDQALGTVQLRAEFPNPELAMLPGEYLRVRLSGGEREAITVPQKAVLQSAQGRFVWTVNSEGKAQQRKVTTGGWIGTDWEIAEGLRPGDVVIVDNLLRLKADLPVQRRAAAEAQPQTEADGAGPTPTGPGARQSG
jgi:membrane fusion protein, multidrug efflux system